MKFATGLFGLLGGLVLVYSCRSGFPVARVDFKIESSKALLERGKNLTLAVCGQCHLDASSNRLTGAPLLDIPPVVGHVYAGNITAHPIKGIGSYSDPELAYLLKTGIARDGRFLPYMTRPMIADEDLKAIIAYLRSGDEPVRASDTTIGVTKLNFIGMQAFKMMAKPFKYETGIKQPDKNDKIANGKYLVYMVGCYHCHSKNIRKVNEMEQEKTKGYMAGGQKTRGVNGEKIYVPNLTFDAGTGIGNWTKEDFEKAVRRGIGRNKTILRYPMRTYNDLSVEQVNDIYDYLKTLPAKHNKVRRI